MKFCVDYFGCRSNQAEIQEWIVGLENAGYQLASSPSGADFGVVNTCCVTEKAEKEGLRFINRVYRNSTIPWIVAGCTVTGSKQKLAGRYKNFFFLDNQEKSRLVDTVRELFPVDSNLIYHSSFKSRIFLKIQDGCNFRCSFCVVPALRGPSRSLSREQVIEKVNYFAALGYREVVLTGINLSSYGYDLFPRQTLLSLLQELNRIVAIDFIRLSSLDPRFIKYQSIKELYQLPKLADSFHFSLQSGSDAVLRRMKRGGRTLEFDKLLSDFNKFFPEANLGADIIIGYPDESDREFKETLAFVQGSPLTYLHLFPFSPRPGTKAALLKPLPPELVAHRLRELKELNHRKKTEYRERFRERILEGIMTEGDAHYSLVVTRNYLSVRVPPLPGFKKKRLRVRIQRIVNENLCEGQLVS